MKLHDLRKKATIPQSRWLTYATAGLATAAATALSAEAEIHYSGPVHLHLQGSESATWRLSLTAGASLQFYREVNVGGNGYIDLAGVARNATVHAVRVGHGFFAANLPTSSNVSLGRFTSNNQELIAVHAGEFVDPGIGYVGFKFDVGNGVQYGWVRMRTNNKGGQVKAFMTVLDFAYADPGEPILTGQTQESEYVTRPPDEGSLGLLALGAVGLGAWRAARGKGRRRDGSAISS